MIEGLHELKRDVFYRLLEMSGSVFVVVRYSGEALIGRRGFLEQEKKHGLVLVFNNKMNFHWDTSGIHANLSFGSVPEKCFIPNDDIVSIHSPDLKVQFVLSPEDPVAMADEASEAGAASGGNVIRVDFKKRV